MSDMKYKNVCLVCGVVLELPEASVHLVQNPGHAIVECMIRWDDTVEEIDINTSIYGRTDTWGDICHEIYSNASSEEQKNRLVQVVNAGFITALKTKNFPLSKGIALAFKNAGAITQEDYDLIDACVPDDEFVPEE